MRMPNDREKRGLGSNMSICAQICQFRNEFDLYRIANHTNRFRVVTGKRAVLAAKGELPEGGPDRKEPCMVARPLFAGVRSMNSPKTFPRSMYSRIAAHWTTAAGPVECETSAFDPMPPFTPDPFGFTEAFHVGTMFLHDVERCRWATYPDRALSRMVSFILWKFVSAMPEAPETPIPMPAWTRQTPWDCRKNRIRMLGMRTNRENQVNFCRLSAQIGRI